MHITVKVVAADSAVTLMYTSLSAATAVTALSAATAYTALLVYNMNLLFQKIPFIQEYSKWSNTAKCLPTEQINTIC